MYPRKGSDPVRRGEIIFRKEKGYLIYCWRHVGNIISPIVGRWLDTLVTGYGISLFYCFDFLNEGKSKVIN